MKLAIIVPCYNEADNIPLILKRFSEVIEDRDIEVILVNNGSTDNSATVLETLLPKYTFARTVLVEVNQGYGYGILTGLKAADADYLGWTHADMQTDPRDVANAYDIIKRNYRSDPYIFVKGNRKGRPFSDNFFTMGMSVYESILLGEMLYDINAQPNIFPKSFYDTWQQPPHDFSLDLFAYYMAIKSGLKVIKFPVVFPERIHGESKWNTGFAAKKKFIKRTIDFSKKLKESGIK